MPSQPRLKHVKQRPRECILATIACLRGIPYSRVRAYANRKAQRHVRRDYVDLFPLGDLAMRNPLIDITTRFGFRPQPFLLYRNTRYDRRPWRALATVRPSALWGTGMLFTHTELGSHVVAFQDRIVYDSAFPQSLASSDWRDIRLEAGIAYVCKIVRTYNRR